MKIRATSPDRERHREEAVQGAARARFRLEVGSATLGGFLFLLTLVWRDWIEALIHIDPDRHSGSLEWLLASGFLVIAAALARLAFSELRHKRVRQPAYRAGMLGRGR